MRINNSYRQGNQNQGPLSKRAQGIGDSGMGGGKIKEIKLRAKGKILTVDNKARRGQHIHFYDIIK
jgi:hypothetical protein